MAVTTPIPVDVRLLGRPRFSLAGSPLTFSGFPRLPLLCAYLVLNREPHRRDRVAFTLWPDDPEEQARANLRRHLHAFAAIMPKGHPPWLLVTPALLQWNPAANAHIDVDRFLQSSESEETLEEAVDLYSGELLEGFEDEWIAAPRAAFAEMQLRNLIALARRYRARSQYTQAVASIRALLQMDPWREDAVRELLVLRSETGDRAGALAEYRAFAQRLRDEIGAEPAAETTAVYQQIQERKGDGARQKTNIPADAARFIGRSGELQAVRALLAERRTVSICGPPGIGKTRLALAVARQSADAFPGGVWLVPLSTLSDDQETVCETLLRALRIIRVPSKSALESICEAIGASETLVIFDAAEHAPNAAPHIARELLERCEGARILTSSREPLKIAGEAIFRLMPMPRPDAQALFLERAALLDPHYAADARDMRAISDICERLDGIPLAIEIAAARMNVLAPPEIVERLGSIFQAQHPLRSALEWSYGLFSARTKALYARLGVFAGGFTIDAVQDVCAQPGEDPQSLLDVLSDLVDKSFVIAEKRSGATRYGMLDALADFAREKLSAGTDEAELHRRHAQHYTTLVTRGATPGRLEDEIDNLRQILRAQNSELAVDLYPLWLNRFFAEGRRWIGEYLLAAPEGPPPTRARALNAYAILSSLEGDPAAAEPCARTALELHQTLGDGSGVAESLHALGMVAHERGNTETALTFFDRSLGAAREAGDSPRTARALDNIGLEHSLRGDFERASRALHESLTVYQELGDDQSIAWVRYHLAGLAYHRGDYPEALDEHERSLTIRRRFNDDYSIASSLEGIAKTLLAMGDLSAAQSTQREALRLWHRVRSRGGICISLEILGAIALREKRVERAALYYGAADRYREPDSKMDAPERAAYEADVALATASDGESWNRGMALALKTPVEEIVEELLRSD